MAQCRSNRSVLARPRVISAVLALVAALMSVAPLAAPAHAETLFRLEPHTRVKVTVLEWIASQGDYREWAPLNGEYAVSRSGTVSIPLVGELEASGRTTGELAGEIAERLKRRTGLVEAPATTVEVVRYPPVYVTGNVERPGEFEYRPGLNVLQALAMAGGRARRSDSLGGYSELEQIRQIGELGRIDLELTGNLIRSARLRAELAGRSQIDPAQVPAAGPARDTVEQLVRDERTIFEARTSAHQRQLASLKSLGTLFREEIDVLEEKMIAQDRQIEIAQEELDNIAGLVKSGTVTRSRETGLERIVADLRSDRLDLAVAAMRARQRLSETERDALSLEGERRTEIGNSLQAVNLAIDELRLRRGIAEQLLQAAGASLARRDGRALELAPLRYTLVRDGDEPRRIEAAETTVLRPGDVLDVRFDPVGMAAGAAESPALAQARDLVQPR